MRGITILGIGNTLMGDDGVGAVVARLLARSPALRSERVVERPNAEMGLIKYFLDSERIFVIDALDVGADPGSVYRFTPDQGGITSLRSNNIHGMGVGYLVANARLSGVDPDVIVYGIQVGDVRPHADQLTNQVQSAAEAVAEMVEREVADGRAAPAGIRGIAAQLTGE